VHLYLVVTTR